MNAMAISGGRPVFGGGRRLVAVAFLGLAASGAAHALAAQQLLGTGDLPSLAAGPPDQRIQYGAGPFQFGNLRLPKRAGPHPVVVFIHGGCWLSAFDIAHAGSLEQAIADSGFAVGASSIGGSATTAVGGLARSMTSLREPTTCASSRRNTRST